MAATLHPRSSGTGGGGGATMVEPAERANPAAPSPLRPHDTDENEVDGNDNDSGFK
uniref:Uncharacterized protein n=1 Tax=Oryza sativa subsp. japonica TaxID=39947 RepID=Q69KZ4_ORYSJ|nr:hypothetical protein [Oryza sativa Japonica Group]BAD34123.1 hypothetical protein [Oryza sativa Japonica Group]